MSISLNMIIGPFKEPFLLPAVESSIPLVDEIILVDTAPENNSNIDCIDFLSKEYGAKVISFPRKSDNSFSYSMARNVALKHSIGEWILRLDADEILREETIPILKGSIANLPIDNGIKGIEVTFYHHMIHPDFIQEIDDPKVLLFKSFGARWVRKIHEIIRLKGEILKLHDIKFDHYGYCRGQKEVFKRWELYEKISNTIDWYHNEDPEHILDGRLKYLVPYKENHPAVVMPVLLSMFPDMRKNDV